MTNREIAEPLVIAETHRRPPRRKHFRQARTEIAGYERHHTRPFSRKLTRTLLGPPRHTQQCADRSVPHESRLPNSRCIVHLGLGSSLQRWSWARAEVSEAAGGSNCSESATGRPSFSRAILRRQPMIRPRRVARSRTILHRYAALVQRCASLA
jgi:hypothetical protein